MEDTQPFHPIVQEILQSIEIAEQGDRSQLPDDKFHHFEVVIADQHKDNVDVCHQLLYTFLKLSEAGLPTLARQLFDLAKIGMKQSEIERAMSKAESIKPHEEPRTATPELTKPRALGVGFKK